MNKRKAVIACIIISMCLAGSSYADRRSYVWTYEYTTMPAGIAEAEYYLTVKVPDIGAKEASSWEQQLELEYGLTENWDVSMYQVFSQGHGIGTNSSSEFGYDGFKLRTRYKLFKKGEFIVDPLLYFEYIRNSNLADPDVLEAKLILAKDLGNFNIAYNAIVERALGSESETAHEYAAGVSYAWTSGFRAGLEVKGSYTEGEHAAGPVVSMETESLWIAMGAIFGLNDDTKDVQARMIAGFAF